MAKKAKRKRKGKVGKGWVSRQANKYADMKTVSATTGKIDFKNTTIKTLTEIGTVVGSGYLSYGIGGFLNGYATPGLGLALIVGGNLLGDPTKLMSIAGAAMLAYGIAKSEDNKVLAKNSSLQGLEGAKSKIGEGFTQFTTDLLAVVGIDKTEDKEVGSIDLSVLDQFEDLNEAEAIRFQSEGSSSIQAYDQGDDSLESLEQEEFAFAQYSDPLSTI